MKNIFLFSVLAVLSLGTAEASAAWRRGSLDAVNARICGKLVDHSHNHGADRRIWSPALKEKRDLYVYLPPGYDPCQRYPLLVYLHGYAQDETTFLESMVEHFDDVIVRGKLGPVVIAFPDGSIRGRSSIHRSASFFANTDAGPFEDFLMQDVWNFLFCRYSLRPEREAHVLIGVSMGGSAAYRLPLVYPDRFKVLIGFMPALNLRWVDCHGRYAAPFDPCCWGWRTALRPYESVGRFYGVITIRYKDLIDPIFGRGPDALCRVSRINPIELLDVYDVRPGMFDMFIAYAGQDEFNIMAHVESYLYRAKKRCLPITVVYDPEGTHSLKTGEKLFPQAIDWLAPRVAAYCPPLVLPTRCPLVWRTMVR